MLTPQIRDLQDTALPGADTTTLGRQSGDPDLVDPESLLAEQIGQRETLMQDLVAWTRETEFTALPGAKGVSAALLVSEAHVVIGIQGSDRDLGMLDVGDLDFDFGASLGGEDSSRRSELDA